MTKKEAKVLIGWLWTVGVKKNDHGGIDTIDPMCLDMAMRLEKHFKWRIK